MRIAAITALAAVMVTASLDADAGGGRYHHHRARIGVFIGAPILLSPFWYSPGPYYHTPPVVVRERVIVREPLVFYDEYGNPVPPERPQPQQPQSGAVAPTWFFCADSQSYYPYVQTCATQWQRVVPQPPPPAQ